MTHSSFGLQPLKVRCTSMTAHPNGPGPLEEKRQTTVRTKKVRARHSHPSTAKRRILRNEMLR